MKPQPLFIGEPDQTHEDTVRSYVTTMPGECKYSMGDYYGQWVIGGRACWVTLVSVGPADWRLAVFEDSPAFRV